MSPPTALPTNSGGLRITVVTVVFNDRDGIARTIESVLAQDYPALETMVIDGGSSDGTQEIVQRFGDAIHHFVSERDQGVYDGMNKAVELSKSDLILFMNSGDVFASPDALSQLLAAAEPASEQILFGRWLRVSGPGQRRECAPNLKRGIFNHQAVAYSRSIHRWHGGYVVVPGFTAADYLFFATLFASPRVNLKVVDVVVAAIDTHGMSAGVQTLSQKHAIDYLCGRAGRLPLATTLVLHPSYARVKRALRWMR